MRDIDLGIAVGSAAKTAAVLSVDCRCQTRIAVAGSKLGIIKADVAVALSLSPTHKNIGFDRTMPSIDFDPQDLPPTGTLPIAARAGRLAAEPDIVSSQGAYREIQSRPVGTEPVRILGHSRLFRPVLDRIGKLLTISRNERPHA